MGGRNSKRRAMMIDMLMDVIILEIMLLGMKVRTPALITDFHILAVYNAVPHQLLTKIFYEQVWDSFVDYVVVDTDSR